MRPIVIAALLVVSCSAQPPAVTPSPSPATKQLRVIAAGADGPVAGLRVCATTVSGTQTCAPTGPDGIASFRLAPGAYLVRSETPPSQRRLGELLGADLTTADSAT